MTFSSFFRYLWRNRTSRYALLASLVGLLYFLVLPAGSKYLLRQWLLDNGADGATIGKIRLDPFAGRVYLANVSITRNGQTVLSDSTVFVNLGVRALFDREALLEHATLTQTVIDIERYDDGSLRIGSYRIEPSAKGPPAKEGNVPWVFRARKVGLSDVLIRYSQPDLRLALHLDVATLRRLSTDPQEENAGTLDLTGTLNEAPVKLHLSLLKIAPDLHLEGKLECSDFRLKTLAGLLKDQLTGLRGRLSANVGLVVESGENGMTATLKGKVGLSDIAAHGGGWSGSGSIALDGGLGYARAATGGGGKIAVDGLLIASPVALAVPAEELRLNEPELTLKGKTTIGFGEAVTVESDSRLALNNTDFRDGDISVNAGPGTWTGTIRYDSGKAKAPASLDTDGAFDLQNLMLSLPGNVRLRNDHLGVRGTVGLVSADSLTMGFRGNIELAAPGLATETIAAGGETITWQGEVSYRSPRAEEQGNLKVSGSLKADGPEIAFTGKNLGVQAQTLGIDSDTELSLGEKRRYGGSASLAVTDLSVTEQGNRAGQIGKFAVDRVAGIGEGGLSVDRVRADKIHLEPSAQVPVEVAVDSAELLKTTATSDLGQVSFAGLTLKTLAAAERGASGGSARLDTLVLEEGTIRGLKEATAKNLRLENGAYFLGPAEESRKPLATVARAQASPIDWSADRGTRIDKVDIYTLAADYRNQKKAEPTTPQPAAEKKATEDEASRAIPLSITRVEVGGDSSLHYSDETLQPVFQTSVAVKSLSLSPVDLSSPEKPIDFKLSAMIDKYAPLTLSGSFAPLASPFALKQEATLQNYSLNSLSPFAIEAVGLALESGQLDLTSHMTVTGERLVSKNRLKFKNMELVPKNEKQAQHLAAKLPVPLELAIDILSNRKGVIDVSVPVEGKFSDLRVGIENIVVTTLRKAIVEGVAPALAYTALGPTGALVYLGMKIGQSLIATDLPSLDFSPGSWKLSAGQQAILDKVGETLQPKMADGKKTFSICSKVVPGETGKAGDAALTDARERQELYRLGEKREQAVKTYLVERFQLDADRLLICNPTIDYGGSRATVEFME